MLAITGELADLAETTVTEARAGAGQRPARAPARQGRAARRAAASRRSPSWSIILDRTGQVIAQTRSRLGGVDAGLGDPAGVSCTTRDARPIAKGRLGKPVEFGYKAQVVDNADGIVLDYSVHQGNPPDAPLLAPAIDRIKALFGRAPRRGHRRPRLRRSQGRRRQLRDLGVKTVVIPRKGKPSARPAASVEHGRGFRRLVKWRTGSEGRISYLKRRYGWDRTLFDALHRRPHLVRARRARPQQRQDRPPRPGPPRRQRLAGEPAAAPPPRRAPPRPMPQCPVEAAGLPPGHRASSRSSCDTA